MCVAQSWFLSAETFPDSQLTIAEFGVISQRIKNPLHGKTTWRTTIVENGLYERVQIAITALRKVDSKSTAAAILELKLLAAAGDGREEEI